MKTPNGKRFAEQKTSLKKAFRSLKESQRELMHHQWLSEKSVFSENLDSLVVNMSRYLFESPHSEESNYFSTTHHNDEKPFLLVLAMFITNVDLSSEHFKGE